MIRSSLIRKIAELYFESSPAVVATLVKFRSTLPLFSTEYCREIVLPGVIVENEDSKSTITSGISRTISGSSYSIVWLLRFEKQHAKLLSILRLLKS